MRTWLREPIQASRGTLLAITLALGMLAAGGIIGAGVANRRATEARHADLLTRAQVAAIARRIFRLESPSDRELLREIAGALRLCARTPSCARHFRSAVKASSRTSATRRVAPVPVDASARAQRDASPVASTNPPRRRATRLGDRGDASRPPGPSDSQPEPAPSSSPPVNVTAPVPAKVCTPLAGVNC